MQLETWQWALFVLGAVLIGLSKTGIAGLGMLFVAIFANILPTKVASGFVLPMLIMADVVAVAVYRRHTQWRFLWRLFPGTAAGVVLGWLAMSRIDDRQASVLVGVIILSMLVWHFWRKWRGGELDPASHGMGFALTLGMLAGFTTLVANAAGPLMALYLLAMRLPKLEFVGTGAVFFLTMNLFKVPFMVQLDLITPASFGTNLLLAPAVLVGAWLGRRLLAHINQKLFENLALGLSGLAGLRLLW